MSIQERNNICIGCGEAQGDPHKPGCERYTVSPIVRDVDTPKAQGQQPMQRIALPGGGEQLEPGPPVSTAAPGTAKVLADNEVAKQDVAWVVTEIRPHHRAQELEDYLNTMEHQKLVLVVGQSNGSLLVITRKYGQL